MKSLKLAYVINPFRFNGHYLCVRPQKGYFLDDSLKSTLNTSIIVNQKFTLSSEKSQVLYAKTTKV